jgi:tRNA(Phe) wybutosine-synthesizing methylase Tyw3
MSEDRLQQDIVIWFKNNYQIQGKGLIFSVPNGGTRNILEAKKLKQTGATAGVSDLIVLLNKKCLFIELKIEKGVQSEVQEEFQKRVEALGFEYHLVRSLEQFKTNLNK